MKSLALSFFVFAGASLAQAELKYITYDLSTGSVEPVTLSEENPVTAESFRKDSKVLMVQDTAISMDYYIGVFEVTNAQAAVLNWATSKTSEDAVAYAAPYTSSSATPTFSLKGHPYLGFPTEAQWCAYAESIVTPSNSVEALKGATPVGYNIGAVNYIYTALSGGESIKPTWYSPTNWPSHTSWPWAGIASAKHGVYDMYGNVTEYIGNGQYIGGCTAVDNKKNACSLADNTLLPKLVFNIADTTDQAYLVNGYLGARLVYNPNTTFSVRIWVNGTEITDSPIEKKQGEEVSFTLPAAPKEGFELYDVKVSHEGLLESDTDTTFIMPAGNVTIEYIYKQVVHIEVINGEASNEMCVLGESVTITPALPTTYAVFDAWKYDSSLASMVQEDSDTHVLTFAPAESLAPGSSYTFEVSYDTYPRVLVYGGTITVNDADDSLGDHYYSTDATLTISAPEISGYTISWAYTRRTDSGELLAGTTEGATITLTDLSYNDEETYTVKYTPSKGNGITKALPTFPESELPFGYTKTSNVPVVLAGNTYTFDQLKVAKNAVFRFNETTNEDKTVTTTYTIDYDVNELPIGEDASMAFLRVDPKEIDGTLDGTVNSAGIFCPEPRVMADYQKVSPYYLAVTELTKLQRNKIDGTTATSNAPALESSVVSSKTAAETLVKTLGEKFEVDDMALPSRTQCEIAALMGYTKAMQDNKTALQTAILTNTNGEKRVPNVLSSQGQTKAGFYGLLGHYGEWVTDSSITEKGVTVYSDGYNYEGNYNSAYMLEGFWEVSPANTQATCRPLIPSERTGVTLTLKIGDESQTVTVPAGEVDLGAPVVEGKTFKGWLKNSETTPSSTATTFDVSEDTTFTAAFGDLMQITITYEGCEGAPILPAGGQTYLYPMGSAEELSWTVYVNEEKRTDCIENNLLTIPMDATSVKVIANTKATGYLLRLK